MAGARTPETMPTADIRRLIRAAGRLPVERDTLYNVVTPPEADDELQSEVHHGGSSGTFTTVPAL